MDLVQQRTLPFPIESRRSQLRIAMAALSLAIVVAAIAVSYVLLSAHAASPLAGGVGSEAWRIFRAGERGDAAATPIDPLLTPGAIQFRSGEREGR